VRTIVSGIAESFKPEDIIGQRVTVLVNLAPRKLRGVESQGMILMTDTPDGKLAFIEPANDSVANGEQVS
jgi:methionyl-tRNA synthetase